MATDRDLRAAIYDHTAARGRVPAPAELARATGQARAELRTALGRLAERRLLVLEPDGETIRMAPPFSGVPTQHRVRAGGREYFANCSWDALGVVAALGVPGLVRSRCEQSGEPLEIPVSESGPKPVACLAHFAVPAARWWDDIVFT